MVPVITHVALRVANLREAEDFYTTLFDLDVAFREAKTDEGWKTLPQDTGWTDAETAGIDLGLSMLYRGQLAIALEAAETQYKTCKGSMASPGSETCPYRAVVRTDTTPGSCSIGAGKARSDRSDVEINAGRIAAEAIPAPTRIATRNPWDAATAPPRSAPSGLTPQTIVRLKPTTRPWSRCGTRACRSPTVVEL